MTAILTHLPGVVRLPLTPHRDARGELVVLHESALDAARGIGPFVQDNFSRSHRGVLRGLHFQEPLQGKLVQVLRGHVFDVVVDVRRGSPTFGRSIAVELRDAVPEQLWIPPGFAHGFLVLSDGADLLYKSTAPYAPERQGIIRWNDPALAIPWPLTPGEHPTLSPRDAEAPTLAAAPWLPTY